MHMICMHFGICFRSQLKLGWTQPIEDGFSPVQKPCWNMNGKVCTAISAISMSVSVPRLMCRFSDCCLATHTPPSNHLQTNSTHLSTALSVSFCPPTPGEAIDWRMCFFYDCCPANHTPPSKSAINHPAILTIHLSTALSVCFCPPHPGAAMCLSWSVYVSYP